MMKTLFLALFAFAASLQLRAQTVVDVIVNSPNHNTLEAAVIAADLAGTLSGPGPFTVFAPTDAAFNALPAGLVDQLLEDPQGELTQILLYHVVAANALSTSLSDGQMIATIQGSDVTVTIENGNVFINSAQVTTADIVASNGVVHVIDAVLLPPTQPATVVDIIVNSENHNTLEAAVIAAGLAGTLSGDGPFTVFAPTDAAFNALPAGLIEELLNDPQGQLTQILLYHVVAANALSTSLSDGQMIATIQGSDVTVTIENGNVFINGAQVIVADLVADNGVVHVIDAVLLPPTQPTTVVDIIVNSENHNTLEAAVIAAGLAGTLSGDGPFTVFAPTDAAFNALPAGLIEELLNDPQGQLTQILLYHVVAANALSTDLSDGQMIATIQGSDVTVTIENGNVFINGAQVIVADLVADNGVVHVIDAVLLPPAEPVTVVDIIVNSENHNTLEAAVIAAGLAGTLSGDGPFTVFAPTDAAFEALPAGVLDLLLADPQGVLTDVLLYHVVGATALSTSLSDGQVITTLLGEDVTVSINDGNVFINDAQVIVADLIADNGVVHVIDVVLSPPSPVTVMDVIAASPVHATLETAIGLAGLTATLDGDGPFTVFAPTDAAFQAIPAATLNAILADPTGLLTDILLYHVVGSTALSSSLSDGQEITTLLGQDVTVDINNGNVFINDAQVIVADIETDNGVVHVIDAVLTIPDSVEETNLFASAVYPNPAENLIQVAIPTGMNQVFYQVYDMSGAKVKEGNFNSTMNQLNVADLSSGLYTIRLINGNQSSSQNFMRK